MNFIKICFKLFLFIVILTTTGCKQSRDDSASILHQAPLGNNSFLELSENNLGRYKWMNRPSDYSLDTGVLKLVVNKGTDFFNNPEDSSVVGTAPFLYETVRGDFLVKTLVQPDMSSQWNAIALMMQIDSLNWIKFAFENSDATGPSIVSVVTKGKSDDANGAVLNNEGRIWLAMARKNNLYSMHWSSDGRNYHMARLTEMPLADTVKIGIEAQSPVGESAFHEVLFLSIKDTTVQNLRSIN